MNPPDDDDPHGSPYSTGRPNARISVIVPPADVAAAMREALEGPEESGPETMEACAACDHCRLCGGARMTTPGRNRRWRVGMEPPP